MSDTSDNDLELVRAVQNGNKKAFDLLVLKYQHKIVSLVNRFVHDYDEAQDISQEAFIKAYRALKNFRGDSAFYTWLYRIAVNTAKNHLAAKKRRPPAEDIDSKDAEQISLNSGLKDIATPERNLVRDDIRAAIVDAMDNLSDELREAISLRELEGLSYEEIAEVMNCPVGTVRSRIFRAREAIDAKLKPMLAND
jgi:RNA polymerase sigma-70 factor, ECF subfamily